MRGVNIVFSLLAAAAMAGCAGDSTDINQPSGRSLPANAISIVPGASNKGSAAFTPNPLTISLAGGGVVQWTNDDQITDNYGSTGTTHLIVADDGSFESGNLQPGNTFEATFGVEGTFRYRCKIHDAMRGEVTVTP